MVALLAATESLNHVYHFLAVAVAVVVRSLFYIIIIMMTEYL
jgi:hypothetical protein